MLAAARTLLVVEEVWRAPRLCRGPRHTSYTTSKVLSAASLLLLPTLLLLKPLLLLLTSQMATSGLAHANSPFQPSRVPFQDSRGPFQAGINNDHPVEITTTP